MGIVSSGVMSADDGQGWDRDGELLNKVLCAAILTGSVIESESRQRIMKIHSSLDAGEGCG
jgi:hypothetical protein